MKMMCISSLIFRIAFRLEKKKKQTTQQRVIVKRVAKPYYRVDCSIHKNYEFTINLRIISFVYFNYSSILYKVMVLIQNI